ncbi:MAG: PAS domain S-box protein, partial [Candidatus Nanoarchaeia archaeon]|nr:PAS domain S-box protein [Candidatus Nanoarchaeia archaeon]
EWAFKNINGSEDNYYWYNNKLGPVIINNKIVSVTFFADDITEKKIAEEKIKKSEEQYRKLIENVNEGIISTDLKGNILTANPFIVKLIGLPKNEIVGKNAKNLVSRFKMSGSKIIKSLIDLLKGKPLGETEWAFKNINGREDIVSVDIYPTIKNEKKIGFTAVINDITKIKKYEEELKKNEEKYRNLIENSNDIVISLDLNGRLTYISPQVLNYGLSPNNLIGKNFAEIVHPQDAKNLMNELKLTISTGKEFPSRFRIINDKRKIYWFEEFGKIVKDNSGKVIGIQSILRDITSRKEIEDSLKQSEERFKSLFENAPDPYYLMDLKGVIIDGNKSAEELIGYKKDELIGKNVFNLNIFSIKNMKESTKMFKDVLFKGKAGPSEFEIRRKDGKEISIEVITSIVELNGKKTILGLIRDITDKKKAMQEIESIAKFPEENPNFVMRIKDNKFTYVNPAAADFISKNYKNLNEVPGFLKKLIIEVFKSKKNKEIEYKIDENYYSFNAKLVMAKGYVNVYGRNITQRKLAENELKITYETILELNKAKDLDAVYDILIEKISQICKNSYILVSAFDKKTDETKLVRTKGLEKYANKVIKLIGINPMDMRVKMNEMTNDELKTFSSKEIVELKEGFYTLSVRKIPKNVCRLIEKILGIKKVYTIGFTTIKNELLGGVIFLTKEESLLNKNLLETLISQASITIDRHYSLLEIIENEKSLKLSQKRFEEVADQTDAVIWEVNNEGLYTYLSDACEKIYGYKTEELIKKKHFFDISPKDFANENMNIFKQIAKEKKKIKDYVNPIITKQGKLIWVSTNGVPIFGANKEIIGYRGVDIDITNKKSVEDEIKLNEKRLNFIVDIFNYEYKNVQNFLDYSLQKVIELTDSKIGYIYHFNSKTKQFILNTWSKDVMKECKIQNPQSVYELDKTGIWGEAVRQRKPIIINDFQAPNKF